MKQVTLHHYFESTYKPPIPTSRLSFLDLPYDVRHRVYVLANLVRYCAIDLNSDPAIKEKNRTGYLGRSDQEDYNDVGAFKCFTRNKVVWDSGEARECGCRPLPYRLLYVSRAVSEEVSSILYSENKFRICRSNPRGLLPLRNLGRRALASLTSLSVSLNACPCNAEHCLRGIRYHCRACTYCPPRDCDKPLGRISRYDRSVISEWSSLVSRIAIHISPSKLRLVLICESADYETAFEAVQPLKVMPMLKECLIRLDQRPNHEFRRLTEVTIAQVTGRSMDYLKSIFRFKELPEEIRQQILGHTDLVAPVSLQWYPESGLVTHSYCERCTKAWDIFYCPFIYAVFTDNCRCWRMPRDKFLVSRKLREDAIRIFYSRNHFIIRPYGSIGVHYTTNPGRAGDLRTFPYLPQHAFRHLRSIEWVFPPYDGSLYDAHEKHLQDWSDTIDLIAHTTDVSRLSLTVDLESGVRELRGLYAQGILDNRYDAAMWGVYQRIIEPMIELKGLQDLFVHLGWPLDYRKHEFRDQQEKILEKRVMGEHYDSTSRGKVSRSSHEDWSRPGGPTQ